MNYSRRFAEIVVCLALGAGLSIAMGQDVSWDLRNYHLYNPVSVMQGRLDLDFFPVDKQSSNSPLLDFIYAFLALGPLSHFPRAMAAVMGLWYGALVFVVLRLASRLFASFSETERRVLIPLGTLTAVTGAVGISQTGSVSNDVAVGMLVLAGLLFILRAEDAGGGKKGAWGSLVAGGMFFGLSAGAKLTGGVYAPAMVLALFATLPLKTALRAGGFFCIGWLAAFSVSFGWWGWMQWERYANPVFPLFNGIFHSRLAPPLNFLDARFFPRDALQWIAYPFFWAWNPHNHPVYETDFSDPRMAIAYGALAVAGGIAIRDFFLRRRGAEQPGGDILTRPQRIAAAFLVFSYIGWLITTPIIRYALVLEALSALVALATVARLAARYRKFLPAFASLSAAALVCIFCFALTRYPDWSRRDFEDKMFDVDVSWVLPDTLFLFVYEPMGYLAAFVPPESHAQFFGLAFMPVVQNTPLGIKGINMVLKHKGPIVVLFRDEMSPYLRLLSLVGLSPYVKNCRTIKSTLYPPDSPPVFACEASRLAARSWLIEKKR
jgi:hypothetical protein